MRDRPPYKPPIKTADVRVACRLSGPWLRDVFLLRDGRGQTFVRIDGEVYDRGSWVNLPLTQVEVEELYRAIQEAEWGMRDGMQAREADAYPPAEVKGDDGLPKFVYRGYPR